MGKAGASPIDSESAAQRNARIYTRLPRSHLIRRPQQKVLGRRAFGGSSARFREVVPFRVDGCHRCIAREPEVSTEPIAARQTSTATGVAFLFGCASSHVLSRRISPNRTWRLQRTNNRWESSDKAARRRHPPRTTGVRERESGVKNFEACQLNGYSNRHPGRILSVNVAESVRRRRSRRAQTARAPRAAHDE